MPGSGVSPCILVVEDDEKHMKLINDLLEAAGYRVVKAVDGKEAMAHFTAHRPELVITDLNVPGLSGWKLGLWIREQKNDRTTPIIFLSALLADEGGAGPHDFYLPKPFETQKLLQKVAEVLAARNTGG